MADEFKHKDVGGQMTSVEYHAVGGHVLDSQATGDIIYASSPTRLSRLGIGAAATILASNGTIPAWTSQVFLGDANITADTVLGMTTGIQIDQGAATDAIFIGKASDISGSWTGIAEADTWVSMKKAHSNGGLALWGYVESGATPYEGFLLAAIMDVNISTLKSSGGIGAVDLVATQVTGGTWGNVIADANLLSIRYYSGGFVTALIVGKGGDLWLEGSNKGLTFAGSADSALVANEVTLGGYEIGAGNRVLAISQETAVVVEVDETKFSHKMQCRLNGATYFLMLTAT